MHLWRRREIWAGFLFLFHLMLEIMHFLPLVWSLPCFVAHPTHWRTYRWCYVVNWFLYFYVWRDSFSDLCERVFPQLYLAATVIWGMGNRWDIFPQKTTHSLIICRRMWMMMVQWAKSNDNQHCFQKSDARVGLAEVSQKGSVQSIRHEMCFRDI